LKYANPRYVNKDKTLNSQAIYPVILGYLGKEAQPYNQLSF
jgi:hypothetical protein